MFPLLSPSLFSETSSTVKQADMYWWGEKIENIAFLTYFVFSFPIVSAAHPRIFNPSSRLFVV